MTHGGDDEDDDEMWRVRCAACQKVIGYAVKGDVPELAAHHIGNCTATDEQREQALIDMKFSEIVAGLTDAEDDDDEGEQ